MLSPLRLAPCLSLALAIAALAPLARGQEKPASPAPTPAEGAAAAIDPRAIEALRRAFDAQQAKGTHRVKVLAAQGRDALAPAAEIDFVFPDRIRLRSQGAEVISIGNGAWMKMGEKWLPAPPEVRSAARNFGDPARREEMIRNCIAARVLGPSTLNGEAVETYEFRHQTKKAVSRSVFYVTPADGLPRKIEIEAETKGTPVRSVMEYSDYGTTITIEAPKEN